VPEGVGRAPLVDFCNQHNPRARLRDHPNPGPHLGRLPSSARLRVPARSKPHQVQGALARPAGSRPCACAPSRIRDRVAPIPPLETSLAARLSLRFGSSRGFTGQGPDGFRHPAPLDAIPRGESFAPTRSARTPRVVSPWRRRPEKPATPGDGARAGSTCHRSGYELTSRARFRDARHSPQDDPLTRGRRAVKACSRSL